MYENSFSYCQIESPDPGAQLAHGLHRLRGWIIPKGTVRVVDVRARIGLRIFPGAHGLPRADLAAHFKTGERHALAGFEVVIDLPVGPATLVLEALEIEGTWTPFLSVRYEGVGVVTSTYATPPQGPLRWHDFCRSLNLILRAKRRFPDRSWNDLAAKALADLPYPRDLLAPTAPFIGFMDEPATTSCCRFGRIPALGYVFHHTERIRRIWATADLQILQPLDYGRPTPAIASHYPEYPTARDCGYFGLVDVPSQLPNPVSVRLYSEMDDGSLHLVQLPRTRLYDAEEEKNAYTAHEPGAFDEALTAWRSALRRIDVPVLEDAGYHAGVERLRSDFEHRVPRRDNVSRGSGVHRPGATEAPGRLLLVSHNLNFEGAPLFLLDYACHMASIGWQISVLSPGEGPLRTRFEALGATVHSVDTSAVFSAQSKETALDAINSLGSKLNFGIFDLVVCNTFTTFWAVHAARAATRPVLLYVHESTTPASFYRDRLHSDVIALAEESFGLASTVSFTTASTRSYHLDYGRPDNHRIVPGWIDIASLDAWRGRHPRELLRARFNLAPNELLVTNVGTVSDRKGQHTFLRAVDLLRQRHPELAARTRFILLGGRTSPFDDMLESLLARLDRSNIEIHPESGDYLPYYAAADLTVCSSYEESSPRVVLEAMACQTPLLASNVHGVPELARAGLEATLVPAGHTTVWCEALATLLLAPGIGSDLASRARARVVDRFSSDKVLPLHAALAAEVAAARI